MEKLSSYLITHHKEDIANILKDDSREKHFSVNVNFIQLFEENMSLGNSILTNFEETTSQCLVCLNGVQKIILEEIHDGIIKENVHFRVFSLPSCPELSRSLFPGNEDLDLFLQVTGTVIRTSVTKILEYRRAYKCTKCKDVIVVDADFDQKYLIQPPKRCRNPDCKANNFLNDSQIGMNTCRDYQEVKIQEHISQARYGCMPNAVWVILEDDLVDSCKPGDNVTVCGVIKRQFKPVVVGRKTEVQIVIKANHIHVNNDTSALTTTTPEMQQYFMSFWERYHKNTLEGRDIIVRSFCPHIYGLHLVKLAVLVTLAGGSRFHKQNDSGVKTRSEPHILLVGDPGTAKSQFLRVAAKIIMRSILTTGVGSTSAGLTVTAIRESNEWQLEAGALVLSDGGVCCIDEFNSMKEHDRTSIHEAMEQQTISVAKAGIVCKLNTRCSILAATNPKGSWDSNHPITINIGLPTPLLSRFDLVFILRDAVDKDWDSVVAKYILNDCTDFNIQQENLWSLEMLQAYFITIRNLNPVLTDNSNKILAAYYQFQRKAVTRNRARTTVRLLDSLVRLSQAHAKLMFHTEVEVMDAIMAVILIETSMQKESSVLSLDIDIRLASPTDPEDAYVETANTILEKLNLFDIFKEELANFRRRNSNAAEDRTHNFDGISPNRQGNLWRKLNNNFNKRMKSFSVIYKKNKSIESTTSIGSDGFVNNFSSRNSTDLMDVVNTDEVSLLQARNPKKRLFPFEHVEDRRDFNIDDILSQPTTINSNFKGANRTENKRSVIQASSEGDRINKPIELSFITSTSRLLPTLDNIEDKSDISDFNIDDILSQSTTINSKFKGANRIENKRNDIQASSERDRINKRIELNFTTSRSRLLPTFDDIEDKNDISDFNIDDILSQSTTITSKRKGVNEVANKQNDVQASSERDKINDCMELSFSASRSSQLWPTFDNIEDIGDISGFNIDDILSQSTAITSKCKGANKLGDKRKNVKALPKRDKIADSRLRQLLPTVDNIEDRDDISGFNIDDIISRSTAINSKKIENKENVQASTEKISDPKDMQRETKRAKVRNLLQQFRYVPRIKEDDVQIEKKTIQNCPQSNVNICIPSKSQRSIFDTDNCDDMDLDI